MGKGSMGEPLRRPDQDPARFAAYAATLAGDLARLARQHGHDTLAYLLDIARLEAESIVEEGSAPRRRHR